MKKVRIAILGLGNVGKGVWKILNTNKDEIIKRSGYEVEVGKILVRDLNKDRGVVLPEGILTTDPEDIFNDESIKIVIELLGGTNPAKEYILRAIRNKKHVVTANKVVIATKGEELFSAAEEEGVMLNFEASVAGGIPIIHGINESLTANKIEEVIGIINGTTNYILTKMTNGGMDFKDALKEAQEKGYAEADPTSDVEGYDAVYKLGILASLAFGARVDTNFIYREGIKNIEKADIEYARELGYVVKLLAIARDSGNALELRVHPSMLPVVHPLASVNDSFNAVFIKGNAIGDLMLYGRGAGDLPTGSAVVGDIISILRNIDLSCKSDLRKQYLDRQVHSMESTESQYYVRTTVRDIPGVFDEISRIFDENDIRISTSIKKSNRQGFVPFVLVTHNTTECNINKSISRIKSLPDLHKVENVIRVTCA